MEQLLALPLFKGEQPVLDREAAVKVLPREKVVPYLFGSTAF